MLIPVYEDDVIQVRAARLHVVYRTHEWEEELGVQVVPVTGMLLEYRALTPTDEWGEWEELEKPLSPGKGFLEYKMISGTWSGGALYGVVLYQNEENEFVGVNEYR